MLDKRIDILHDYSKGEVYHCHNCGKKSNLPLREVDDHIQLCKKCYNRYKTATIDMYIGFMDAYPDVEFVVKSGDTFIDMQKLKKFRVFVEKPGASKAEESTDSKRIALGLPDTPANNAFVIAGGTNQVRATPYVINYDDWNSNSKKRFRNSKKSKKK